MENFIFCARVLTLFAKSWRYVFSKNNQRFYNEISCDAGTLTKLLTKLNSLEGILTGNNKWETKTYFKTFNDNEITTINNFQM